MPSSRPGEVTASPSASHLKTARTATLHPKGRLKYLFLQTGNIDALGADVALAEDILAVASHGGHAPIFYDHLETTGRFTQRAGAVVDLLLAWLQEVLLVLHRFLT